jgi:hypothetical protein
MQEDMQMSYRTQMLELVVELQNRANEIGVKNDLVGGAAKLRRQAEVLEFIVTHPEGIAEIFKQQEEEEKA